MDNVMTKKTMINPISVEHSNRIYWLGRYIERAFTTLKSLERLHDKVIDRDPVHYRKYLECFGLTDTFPDYKAFFRSFIFDKENSCSVAYSLERAYDNGIVLREEISTDAFAYLQLAIDTLAAAEQESQSLVVALMPLEDILNAFNGCIIDHIYEEEIYDIFFSGKCIERLELYIRLKYRPEKIDAEFARACHILEKIPENTPYRYNEQQLEMLSGIIEHGCAGQEQKALSILGNLMERS